MFDCGILVTILDLKPIDIMDFDCGAFKSRFLKFKRENLSTVPAIGPDINDNIKGESMTL